MPLREARGLVLARDVVAGSPSPRFDTAAMDGYAVQHADIRGATLERPVHLGIVGAGVAGDREVTPVAPGTAVRIMTGAVCPEDADVVIPFELVESRGDQIVVSQPFAAGTNIRRTGEDIAVGSVVVERGTVLRAGAPGGDRGRGARDDRGRSPPTRRGDRDRRRTGPARASARAGADLGQQLGDGGGAGRAVRWRSRDVRECAG